MFRIIILGLGVQGAKRLAIAAQDVVATVDPFNNEADFKTVEDVPLDSYDAAIACIPDAPKLEVLSYILTNGKHVLVEKPLLANDEGQIMRLGDLARNRGVVCYTA